MDLDRLDELAKGTHYQGPWEYAEHRSGPGIVQEMPDGFRHMVVQAVNAGPRTARYIAAVDPETVRTLVEVVRAAQDVRDSGASMLAMSALSEALAAIDKST